jgi:hypothetical protein
MDLNSSLEQFRIKVASFTQYTKNTPERSLVAREYLVNTSGHTGTVLMMALRSLYGIECFYWEPQTIWLTLEQAGIDLSVIARNKLMAAITVLRHPAFFWDNLVFQRTTQALNSELLDPEALQECHPAYMAWAVYECTVLRGLDPETQEIPDLEDDVQQYAAVCLKRSGFVCPPDQLAAVQDNLLNMLPKENRPFAEYVKKTWEETPKKALSERQFGEDPLGIQLAHLAGCYDYVKERAGKMALDVLRIERPDLP